MALEHKEKGERIASLFYRPNKNALIENITIWITKRMQTITTGSTSCKISYMGQILCYRNQSSETGKGKNDEL
jgi:hypothetical protein